MANVCNHICSRSIKLYISWSTYFSFPLDWLILTLLCFQVLKAVIEPFRLCILIKAPYFDSKPAHPFDMSIIFVTTLFESDICTWNNNWNQAWEQRDKKNYSWRQHVIKLFAKNISHITITIAKVANSDYWSVTSNQE